MRPGGCDAVAGEMIDRLAPGGELTVFRPQDSVWEQFPLRYDVTGAVLRGLRTKVMLARGWVRLNHGNHAPLAQQNIRQHPRAAVIHHFKWDSTVKARLSERLSEDWKGRCRWWVETQRFFEHIEHRSCIDLSRVPAVSAP